MNAIELIEALAENLELQLNMRGCQTESAPLKSDADEYGGVVLLREAKEFLKGEQRGKVCCSDCGIKYLTKEQKAEGGVCTFHIGTCSVCGNEETLVTNVRHYNYLNEIARPKNTKSV